MLLSLAEQAKRGMYYIDETPSMSLEPHTSFYLSLLIEFIVQKQCPNTSINRLIELCSRNFEFSRSYVESPRWSVLGIDLTPPSLTGFGFYQPAYDKKLDSWNYYPYYTCKARICVPSTVFTSVEDDVFSFDFDQCEDFGPDEPALIYCRPPEQLPLSKFQGSLQDANDKIIEFLGSRANLLNTGIKIPQQLSVGEWYFTFLAASLICTRPGSVAVIQISNRLLNLARAKDGRRLLFQLGLLDGVVLLPNSIAEESEGCSLLFLRDGEPDRPFFLFDGRSFNDKTFDTDLTRQLLDSVDRAYADVNNEDYWRSGDEQGNGLWSFLPKSQRGSFANCDHAPFKTIAKIRRGSARSAITKLPETILNNGEHHWYCYYLSLKTLNDGSIIKIDNALASVSYSDIYDIEGVAYDATCKLKTLDPDAFTLLISRFGAPFKLALLLPHSTTCDVVPCDSFFYISFTDELLARFVLAYLSSDEGQHKLAETAHGETLNQLSPKDLQSMTIPVPPIEEQASYAREYEMKQQAYENALKQVDRCAATKRTL